MLNYVFKDGSANEFLNTQIHIKPNDIQGL